MNDLAWYWIVLILCAAYFLFAAAVYLLKRS